HGEDASTVVAAALDGLVDAAARMAITAAPRGTPRGERGGTTASATLHWLAALTGPDRSFDATAAQVAALAEGLASWQRDALAGRVRAFFRLVEPAEDADDPDEWRLDFALQATDRPSLLVDAARIWAWPTTR